MGWHCLFLLQNSLYAVKIWSLRPRKILHLSWSAEEGRDQYIQKQYFTPLVCSGTSLAGTAVKQLKAGRLFWLLTCKWADHTLKLSMFHLPSHSLFPAQDKVETLAQRWNIILPFPVPHSNTFLCSEPDWKHWPGGEKCSISSPDASRLWPRQHWNHRLLYGLKKLPSCPHGLRARWDAGKWPPEPSSPVVTFLP